MDSKERARSQCFEGVRGFHRPDPLRKPIEQLEIVGLISEEGLAEVDMSVHEPRKNRQPCGIEDPRFATAGGAGADRGDGPIDDLEIRSHRSAAAILYFSFSERLYRLLLHCSGSSQSVWAEPMRGLREAVAADSGAHGTSVSVAASAPKKTGYSRRCTEAKTVEPMTKQTQNIATLPSMLL